MGTFDAFKSLIRTFNFYDVLDIAVVSFLIYHLIKLVRESRAGQLVKGILIVLLAYAFACQFNLRMLINIFNNFFQFSIFALLIVFQPELRRALEQLGRNGFENRWYFKKNKDPYDVKCKELINVISDSVLSLSDEKMGALIVFERKTKLGDVISTGTVLKAKPSVPLVCNIFFNKSPLHDGALIIRDGVLHAGGCILPLTKSQRLSRSLGTRHRAAVGISENSDAVAVVVSEETGNISIAVNGGLQVYEDLSVFRKTLEELLLNTSNREDHKNILSSFRKVLKHD